MQTRSKRSSRTDAKTKDYSQKLIKDNQNLNQNVIQNPEKMNEESQLISKQKEMIEEESQILQISNHKPQKVQIVKQEQEIPYKSQQQKVSIKYQNSATKSKIQKIQQLPNQQSQEHQQNEQPQQNNSDQSWQQQQLRLISQQNRQQFNDSFYRHSAIQTISTPDIKHKTIKGIIYYKDFQIEVKKTYQIDYYRQNRQQIESNIACKITKIKRNIEKHFLNGQFSFQNNFWILNKRCLNALSRQHGEKYMKQLQQILYYTKKSPLKNIQICKNKFFTLPILSRIELSNLTQIVISLKIDNIQPLSWIQCLNLRKLNIVNTNVTSYKALNKINFPFLKLLEISYNKIPQIYFDRIHINRKTSLKTFQIHKTRPNPFEYVERDIVEWNLQLYNQDFGLMAKTQNSSQNMFGDIILHHVFGYHRIPQIKILQTINPEISYTFMSQQTFVQ